MLAIDFLTLKKNTHYLEEDNTVRQAIEKFDFHQLSVIPLLSKQGEYIASVSQSDILSFLKNVLNFDYKAAEKVNILEVKRHLNYIPKKIDTDIKEIFMLSREQSFVPIVDDRNIFIGIVRRSQILDHYVKENSL